MRRSLLPGMRYPRSAPESNHLLTVRGATLQILATSPVVRTSFTLAVVLVLLIGIFSHSRPAGSLDPRRPSSLYDVVVASLHDSPALRCHHLYRPPACGRS